MRKCTGKNTREWEYDAIFEVRCNRCGEPVEYFRDEITRIYLGCKASVGNGRGNVGCTRWWASDSALPRDICSNFERSKDRFYGRL